MLELLQCVPFDLFAVLLHRLCGRLEVPPPSPSLPRCQCWCCWRRAATHNCIPAPSLLSLTPSAPEKSSVRRIRPDTDLDEEPRSSHIACCPYTSRIIISTFFSFFCPPSPIWHWMCAPGGEDLGRRAHGRGCEGAREVWRKTLKSTSLPGCRILWFFFGARCCQAEWRQLLCAVVFSFIQPSKRTPFR